LIGIVSSAHHLIVFGGLFLLFLGVVSVTREFQTELRLREGLLVSFFLGGLVVLGGPQQWWLQFILSKLSSLQLYFGAIGLTAVADNSALTYLGSLVPNLEVASRYTLVAGAVVGGGLTVIANAPNPAGFGILNESFGKDGISPLGLFLWALPPTIIATICFWP
jgi:predicted cation transporter